MAFFSIIIPTYNSERTIIACLESLAVQNFKDFEIIVVDGKSLDGTIKLLNTFFIKHQQLEHSIISEVDSGAFDAMNKGAALAKGEWLYFLGSDDCLISNETLRKVYFELSRKDSPDFLYGNALFRNTGQVYDGKFTLRRILKTNICHQAIFLRKALFDELGPFDLQFPVHADWNFNLKVFLAKKKVMYANIMIVDYSNQGYSSCTPDIQFENKLLTTKEKYYRHFWNRLISWLHHTKNGIKRHRPLIKSFYTK